jgi:hypothetical protein
LDARHDARTGSGYTAVFRLGLRISLETRSRVSLIDSDERFVNDCNGLM